MIQKFLFFGLIFVIFLLPATDPDFGWQLRCGQQFLTTGQICAKNTFSVLLPNYEWAYPILVYPVILALIFERFGFWGLSALNALVITAAYAFLFHSIKNNNFQKMVFLLIVIPLSWVVFSLGFRSQIFSVLFFTITLFIISKIRGGKSRFGFFLPPLFLIWANTHGGLVFGFLLLLILIAEQLYQKRWQVSLQTTLLLISSFLASLINPFGFRIYKEVLIHSQVPLKTLIAEWVPPSPLHFAFLTFILLILFSSVLFSLINQKRALPVFPLLSACVFILLALLARRNLPFAYFSLIFLYFESHFPSLFSTKKSLPFFLPTSLLMIGILIVVFLSLPKTQRLNTNWQAFCDESSVVYPCQAVEFLKKQKIKGNIYNTYEWGGFLIWQLPEFKVFVDGRMPAWLHSSGKSPYTLFLEIIQRQPGWDKSLRTYKIKWLLIQNGTFLDLELQKSASRRTKDWIKEVYRDKTAVVYSVLK
ncbi:MAG: hypothetical protein HYY87_02530 [Candidatus Levybacteria bacterium]|nr:hypothetical protein [Candidatus Levybacteria bacterium]MBI3070157.1 hypothetical protein [Candidatus Levybacteria bacterium]